MSKVMVVEDDASLREIYSIRVTAEGYEVVTAGDGEEALAIAVREKPDLILSDVMMPKISGFDMLDILRSTPETANIKVVMMTALSAEDQKQRGERLGADRYLVKSQVGIEDVINTIHEVLGDKAVATGTAPATPEAAPATPAPAPATPEAAPAAPQAMPEAPATPEANPAPAMPAEPAPATAPVEPDPNAIPQADDEQPANPAQ
ncbi:response regulator [Candidatus Saccharibacteria bacterium]|nr:response regulator [Candidatus Saccharibacteria bacterium]